MSTTIPEALDSTRKEGAIAREAEYLWGVTAAGSLALNFLFDDLSSPKRIVAGALTFGVATLSARRALHQKRNADELLKEEQRWEAACQN